LLSPESCLGDLGCFRLGNLDFDSKIWILDFRIKHEIQKQMSTSQNLFSRQISIKVEIHLGKGFRVVEIRFWISHFIGKSKIQILESKSRFPNRKHPWSNSRWKCPSLCLCLFVGKQGWPFSRSRNNLSRLA